MITEFTLTDGTTRIDLLQANRAKAGCFIESYTPGRANYKGGGVWQDSPLTPGRRLTFGTYANVTDTIVLSIAYSDYDALMAAEEELENLLAKANDFWTTKTQGEPVWLEAKTVGEDDKRYALIYYVAIDDYPDPFAQPFANRGRNKIISGLTIGVERSFWLATQPEITTDVEVAHDQHTTETSAGVIVGNRQNALGAISWVGTFNAGTSAYSANLASGSLPYNLFAGTIQANTAVYFGSPAPFGNLVFDIGTAFTASSYTLVWEYWNGSAWTALTTLGVMLDSTDSFTLTGVHSVRWRLPTNWAANQPDGTWLSRYYVRARISAVSSPSSTPAQQNRQPYTPLCPFIDIASDQVYGDVDALARFDFILEDGGTNYTGDSNQENIIGRALMGLRSYDRGDSFAAYINMVTAANPTGVSVAADNTTLTQYDNSSADSVMAYTGSSSDTLDDRFTVTFATSISPDYYGVYRLFTRVQFTGAAAVNFRYEAYLSTNRAASIFGETKAVTPGSGDWYLIDLGRIELPPVGSLKLSEAVDMRITIQSQMDETATLRFNDLILLPIDEWSADVDFYRQSQTVEKYVQVDSIGNAKETIRAFVRESSDNDLVNTAEVIAAGPAILHASRRQRLWTLTLQGGGSDPDIARLGYLLKVRAKKQQRYQYLRRR